MKRRMWSKMSLEELGRTPAAASWMQLRKRMAALDPVLNLDVIKQIAAWVKKWPIHVSRPPDKRWKRPDPRLDACLVISEEVTYKPLHAALCAAFRLRSGETAIFLQRRWVGQAFDAGGGEIQVNRTGEADLSSWFVFEHTSGVRLAVYLAVEVKMDGGTRSPEQLTEQERIERAGGISVCVVGEADAIVQLQAARVRVCNLLGEGWS